MLLDREDKVGAAVDAADGLVLEWTSGRGGVDHRVGSARRVVGRRAAIACWRCCCPARCRCCARLAAGLALLPLLLSLLLFGLARSPSRLGRLGRLLGRLHCRKLGLIDHLLRGRLRRRTGGASSGRLANYGPGRGGKPRKQFRGISRPAAVHGVPRKSAASWRCSGQLRFSRELDGSRPHPAPVAAPASRSGCRLPATPFRPAAATEAAPARPEEEEASAPAADECCTPEAEINAPRRECGCA